ncbi:uncharacterized protein LOC124811368 [Hydra vulgaris]|uniref:uncharacterized protein LOC124811368 n=1 Tax=Hydra vulgaris TaxID=6087 RepID=UPI001F5EE0D5|nr:uncharacterized protein LOC124811368 [Hydra vulgaris]
MGFIIAAVVLILITLSIAVGLAGLIIGCAGRSWLKTPFWDQGLWSLDAFGETLQRNNIFRFKNSDDIILVLIIIGAAFALMAFVCVLTICCCRKNPSRRRICSITLIILTFFTAVSGLAAVIYAEVLYKSAWSITGYRHGYAFICAWIGACACFVSLVLSCINICINPSNTHSIYNNYPKNEYKSHSEKVLQMDNLGYR